MLHTPNVGYIFDILNEQVGVVVTRWTCTQEAIGFDLG
jgi:hypothetical protein